jgi:hypothetical protein
MQEDNVFKMATKTSGSITFKEIQTIMFQVLSDVTLKIQAFWDVYAKLNGQ